MRDRARRPLVAGLGALAIMALAAAPAWAKFDIRRVVVTGPGIAGAITLKGDQAWAFLIGSRGPESSVVVPAPRDPGTAYSLTVVHEPGPDPRPALYPFAGGGAVLEIGDDEMLRSLVEWNDHAKHTGWVAVSPGQMELLWTRGLPRTEPATEEPEPVADDTQAPAEADPIEAATARESREGTAQAGAILGAAAVLIAGMLMLRSGIRRRSGE